MVDEIKARTKKLALDVIMFCRSLPQKQEYWIIGKQLIRSATSVGANYRAACRGKSKADFIAKLGIVEEEADESLYWMELLAELNEINKEQLRALYKEMNELLSIIVASRKTAKKNEND